MTVEMLGVPSPKAYLSMSKTRNLLEQFLKGVNFASCSAEILRPTKEVELDIMGVISL